MNITAKTKVCMVIGDPIKHSLSPQMHNAAYEDLGIDNDMAQGINRSDTQLAMTAAIRSGMRGFHPDIETCAVAVLHGNAAFDDLISRFCNSD